MTDFQAIQKLDLNLLKVFEGIYQEQSMSRTAELLHITPSAVSHALRRLPACLDDPRFQRNSNRMLPTPACQRMAPLIIDNLSRLRQILQHWGEFQPATSRHHFRIGMHYALEPSIFPRLAQQLLEYAPNTSFASVKVERQHLTRELGEDISIWPLTLRYPLSPRFCIKICSTTSFVSCCVKGIPLLTP